MKQQETSGTGHAKLENRYFRHVPPTAVPITLHDLWQGINATQQPQAVFSQFHSLFSDWTGNATCHLVSSGRAALTLILRGLKRQTPHRSQVIIPAYGCPTIVQSVLQAGLEPILCDVSLHTLDLDRQKLVELVNDQVLAVIPVHLYGLAQDVTDLLKLGLRHGFYVIEDAAQAFGALFRGQMVGTRGDAGLYSLGRGKCLPTGHGGVIVARPPLDAVISEVITQFIKPTDRLDLRSLVFFLGYGVATRPFPWWFITRTALNPAGAGMDVNTLPPIKLTSFSPVQAGIGLSLLQRAAQINATRRHHARQLMSQLSPLKFLTLPQIPAEAEPVYLRLPIVARDKETADHIFQTLWKAGLGISRSYTKTLPALFADKLSLDTNKQASFPVANHLADSLLTLPTHPYLAERDVQRIIKLLQAIKE